MNGLNSLIIEGNMVRDPEFGETTKGTQFCCFSIATNRVYTQNNETTQEVSYFDVEAWTSMALLCKENGAKGRGVRVVGRLKQDRWIGKDGKNYSKVKVVAEHIEFKPKFSSSKSKKVEKNYDYVAK